MKTTFRSFEPVRGTVDTIRSYNPENGFTIARLLLDDGVSLIHMCGFFPGIRVGEWLTVKGVWVKHSRNGWRLEVKQSAFEVPSEGADLEIYLAQVLHGVTPELAERIVQNCGVDSLRVIEQAPERLRDISGLNAQRIRQIQASWKEQKQINELRALLMRPGVNRTLAMQVYAAFRAGAHRTPKKIKPLLEQVYALDFAAADSIAALMGIPPNTPPRIDAGVRDRLRLWNAEGHVVAERAGFVTGAMEALRANKKSIESSLKRLAEKGELVVEGPRIYAKPMHELETAVAKRIQEIAASHKSNLTEFQENDWSKAFNWLALRSQIVLTPPQQEAVKTALTSKVTILTGGPGTGKTTTVRAMVELLEKKGYSFQLAAPTGRAAKRLSAASGAPAQTLHRLLAFKPIKPKKKRQPETGETKYARALERPLEADLIIVDESSMLDLALMNDLVQSVGASSHLLFVGDPNQLPSIGAGKVLQDLMDSHALPVITLDTIFRQKQQSSIVLNAHRIQQGQRPILADGANDFFVVSENRPEKAAQRVIDLVTTQIPVKFGFDSLEDIQVLSPTHHGPAGVSALNRELQAALNPRDPRKPEWQHHDRILRLGDRVLQTRNNYTKGVFNGDCGRIVWMDVKQQCLTVEFQEQRAEYGFNELDELGHAFALTVHKAQGSEYRAVVLVLLGQHQKLLERNLLYTAVTRAKQLVVIVGAASALAAAIKNNRIAERHSYLAQRIAGNRVKRETSKVRAKGRKGEMLKHKGVNRTRSKGRKVRKKRK